MKVVFLDYDGVVNTPIWDENHYCGFNFPEDGKVNNYQACQWLNKLCKKFDLKIVVTSTWRYCCHDTPYQDCLYNGGLDKSIEIIGCTDWFGNMSRYDEIKSYLENHKEIERYIILDDDKCDDENYVYCNPGYGFGIEEYMKAEKILKKDKEEK